LRAEADARRAEQRHAAAASDALGTALGLRDRAFEEGFLEHDGSLPFDDVDAVTPLLAPTQERLRAVEALLPLAEERLSLEQRLSELEGESVSLADALRLAEADAALLPERRVALAAAIVSAAEQGAQAAALTGEATAWEARITAAERLILRKADHARAEAAERTATEALFAAKEVWLGAQESRLHGMAAELAADLAAGHACPVCGSDEHPQHAVAAPGTATLADVKAARSAVDDAELARTTAESELRSIGAEVSALTQAAGEQSIEEMRTVLGTVAARRVESEAALAELPELQAALEAVDAQQRAAGERLAALREAQAATAATQRALSSRRDELDSALTEQTLERLTAHQRLGEALRTALTTVVGHHQRQAEAQIALRAARAELWEALAAQQFTDAEAVRSAALDLDRLRALERAISEHETARAAAEATLQLPEVRAALAQPEPDLAALLGAAEQTQAAEQEAIRTDTAARRRTERVSRLAAEVRAGLQKLAPRRDAALLAAELAALVEGKSANNHLKMRLSAYVLSWRLAQVVAAANERLARMSDGRYLLEHTEQRGAQESRGGLSLVVRDAWSGEARDPATLSGGETFIVSLALALGLADVVAGEAGGTELDTLFVDEGFGSLDSETLDDVMDTLDALREGGRVVGVVSHVDQMRQRIPRQLRLTKGRTGSRVESHFAAV
ncbi:SMC family ATPase, partial [Nocardioides dubius]